MSARFCMAACGWRAFILLGLGWWLQRAARVRGDGGWRPVSAFRVRATVLQEVSTLPSDRFAWRDGGCGAHRAAASCDFFASVQVPIEHPVEQAVVEPHPLRVRVGVRCQ